MTVISNKCVGALFSRHLVIAAAAIGEMQEATVLLRVAQEVFQHRITVLHKTGICVGIQPKCAECNDDLCGGFRVCRTERCKAAIILLHTGQQRKCCFDCRFDFRMFFVVVRCKCLKRHRSHISVCGATIERPAVADTVGKNCFDQLLTFGVFVVSAVHRKERPNRTIAALLFHIVQIVQRGQKVMTAHTGGIFANSSQGKNDAGVFGRFGIVQLFTRFDVCLHIGYNTVIIAVIVAVCDVCVTACQTKNCPFTTYRTNLRCGNRFLDVGKRLIQILAVAGVLTRAALFQLFKCLNRLFQLRCVNAGFVGQRVIRSLCGVDLLLVGKGDFVFVGQIVNQLPHMVFLRSKHPCVALIDDRNRFRGKILFLIRSQRIERCLCGINSLFIAERQTVWVGKFICGSCNGICCGHIINDLFTRNQLVILGFVVFLESCLSCWV